MPKAAMRPLFILMPTCLLCAAPAAADELPKRKAGLWEIKMVVGGREAPLRKIQQCTDAETDTLMTSSLEGLMGSKCDKPTISVSGDKVIVDASCKIGSTVRTTRAVIAGDFNSAYTVTVMARTADDAAQTAGSGSQPPLRMEATWIGPCQKGQRPGDLILPGGIRLNVRSLGIESGTPPRP